MLDVNTHQLIVENTELRSKQNLQDGFIYSCVLHVAWICVVLITLNFTDINNGKKTERIEIEFISAPLSIAKENMSSVVENVTPPKSKIENFEEFKRQLNELKTQQLQLQMQAKEASEQTEIARAKRYQAEVQAEIDASLNKRIESSNKKPQVAEKNVRTSEMDIATMLASMNSGRATNERYLAQLAQVNAMKKIVANSSANNSEVNRAAQKSDDEILRERHNAFAAEQTKKFNASLGAARAREFAADSFANSSRLAASALGGSVAASGSGSASAGSVSGSGSGSASNLCKYNFERTIYNQKTELIGAASSGQCAAAILTADSKQCMHRGAGDMEFELVSCSSRFPTTNSGTTISGRPLNDSDDGYGSNCRVQGKTGLKFKDEALPPWMNSMVTSDASWRHTGTVRSLSRGECNRYCSISAKCENGGWVVTSWTW